MGQNPFTYNFQEIAVASSASFAANTVFKIEYGDSVAVLDLDEVSMIVCTDTAFIVYFKTGQEFEITIEEIEVREYFNTAVKDMYSRMKKRREIDVENFGKFIVGG